MPTLNFEVIMTLLILALVGWAALRQGKANPIDTGTLQRDVAAVKQDVAGVKKDIGNVRAAMTTMQTNVTAIRSDLDGCPTGDDIAALKELMRSELGGIDRAVSATRELAEKTDQAVIRIEMLLMERALPPASGGRSRR